MSILELKHKWFSEGFKRLFRKGIALVTVATFLSSVVVVDKGRAVETINDPGTKHELLVDIRDGLFDVPNMAGEIQDSYLGDRGRVIINIQDAHCDYFAQHSIDSIIEYLGDKYGISLLFLEGGAGEYDHSPFLAIKEDDLREKVADFFVKEGTLNAAEFARIKHPDKYMLWGVEEPELYLKNLEAYKATGRYRDQIQQALKQISFILNNIKVRVYTEELLQLDLKYAQYKNNNLDLKDYITSLIDGAKTHDVDIKGFPNIYLLQHVLEEEAKIDFKQANRQRDAFIEAIRKSISYNQAEAMLKKTVEFRSGAISQKDYYEYLLGLARQTDVEVEDYPFLQKYIVYIAMYTSIDKSKMFNDLSGLEDVLRAKMCVNDEQRELSGLSKDFVLLKRAFDFSLTKEDFKYFSVHITAERVSQLFSFLNKEAGLYKIKTRLTAGAADLADRLSDVRKFYECSFERDKVFIDKIKAKMDETGIDNAVLFTGGFHTENLAALFRENGFSYVTVMPRFKDEKGYECPYFKLLGGGYPNLQALVIQAISSSTLQVASIWSALGVKVQGENAVPAAVLQLRIVEELLRNGSKEPVILAVSGKNAYIEFYMENGNVKTRALSPENLAGRGVIADYVVTNPTTLQFVDQETNTDEILKKAYDENRFEKVDLASVQKVLEGVVGKDIAESLLKGVTVNQIRGVSTSGASGFRGHASWRGININADLSANDKIAVIIHELGAYYLTPHEKNIDVEALSRVIDAKGNLKKGAMLATMKALFGDINGRGLDKNIKYTETDRLARMTSPSMDFAATGTMERPEAPAVEAPVTLAFLEKFPDKKENERVDLAPELENVKVDEIKNRAIGTIRDKQIQAYLKKWEIGILKDTKDVDGKFERLGVVDHSNRERPVLYINETLRNMCNVAPELLAVLMLDLLMEKSIESGISGGKINAIVNESLEGKHLTRNDIVNAFANMSGVGNDYKGKGADLRIADVLIRLRPGTTVLFGDVMAGKAKANYFGEKIMDYLRPEYTRAAITFLREKGIFAFDYGKDEMSIALPDGMEEKEVKQIQRDLARYLEGLATEQKYTLYRVKHEKGDGTIEKIQSGVAGKGKVYFSDKPDGSNVLFVGLDRNDIAGVSGLLKGIEETDKDIYTFYSPLGAVKFNNIGDQTLSYTEYLNVAESMTGKKFREDDIEKALARLSKTVSGERVVDDEMLKQNFTRAMKEYFKALGMDVDVLPLDDATLLAAKLIAFRELPVEAAPGKLSKRSVLGDSWKDYDSQRSAVERSNWLRAYLYGPTSNFLPKDYLARGLSGLNMDPIRYSTVDYAKYMKDKANQTKRESSLKGTDLQGNKFDWENAKRDIRRRVMESIGKILKPKAGEEGYAKVDPYTGYSAEALEELVDAIKGLNLTPDDVAKMNPLDRLFFLRAPPVNTYGIYINADGSVTVFNIDVMAHTSGLEGSKGMAEELSRGLAGRLTDYLVLNMVEKEDLQNLLSEKNDVVANTIVSLMPLKQEEKDVLMQLRKLHQIYNNGMADDNAKEEFKKENVELRKLLEATDTPRMFPFKALNSYALHDLADDIIMATHVAVMNKIREKMFSDYILASKKAKDAKKDFVDGRGTASELREAEMELKNAEEKAKKVSLDAELISEAIKDASIWINNAIDPDKFVVEGERKTPPRIMLEAEVVANERLDNVTGKDIKGYLDSLAAVRDPLTNVRGKEELIIDNGIIVGRNRVFSNFDMAELEQAYKEWQGYVDKAAEDEARDKTEWFKFLLDIDERMDYEAERKAAVVVEKAESKDKLKELYSSSRDIIRNVKELNSPLYVFIQCPEESMGQKTGMSKAVLREMTKKYNISPDKLIVRMFTSAQDLEDKVTQMMNKGQLKMDDPKARAVVFYDNDAKSNIIRTPEEQDRMFKGVSKELVYYVAKEGMSAGSSPEQTPIGPLVAFALAIKQYKISGDELVLNDMQNLLLMLSGKEEMRTVDFRDFIDKLLKGQAAITIQKIDFESLKEEIKAEESALISL